MASTHTSGRIVLAVATVFLCAGLLGGTVADVTGTSIADRGSANGGARSPAAIDDEVPQVDDDDRNRLVIDSTGDERVFYEVTVSGSIELGEEANPVEAEVPDSASGNTASGSVLGGTDDFFFTGEITNIEIEGGSADVYVNGERIDPDDVEGTTTTTADTETMTGTVTDTETMTDTDTTAVDTTISTATATGTEETVTDTPTATETGTRTASRTGSPAATTTDSGGSEGATGLNEQERGLFLTIGAVLLLGIVAIGGFALLARR